MKESKKFSNEQRRALTTLIRYRLDLAVEHAEEENYSQRSYAKKLDVSSSDMIELLRVKGVKGHDKVAKQLKKDLRRWHERGLVDHYVDEPFRIVFGERLFEEKQSNETYEQYLSNKVVLDESFLAEINRDYKGTFTILRYANQTKYGKNNDNTVYIVSSELHIETMRDGSKVLPFNYEFHSEHSGNKPYEVEGFALPTLSHLHFHGFSDDPFSPVLFTVRREKKPIRLNGLLTRKHFSAVPFSSRIVVVKQDEQNRLAFKKLPPRFDERLLFPVEGKKIPAPNGMTEKELMQIRVDIKKKFMLNSTGDGEIPLKMV